MALETVFIIALTNFQRRSGLFRGRHVVLLCLEIGTAFLVAENGGLVGKLPVAADRSVVALVASTRGGNRLPGGKHGATDREE